MKRFSEGDRHERGTGGGTAVNIVDSSEWLEYFADGADCCNPCLFEHSDLPGFGNPAGLVALREMLLCYK